MTTSEYSTLAPNLIAASDSFLAQIDLSELARAGLVPADACTPLSAPFAQFAQHPFVASIVEETASMLSPELAEEYLRLRQETLPIRPVPSPQEAEKRTRSALASAKAAEKAHERTVRSPERRPAPASRTVHAPACAAPRRPPQPCNHTVSLEIDLPAGVSAALARKIHERLLQASQQIISEEMERERAGAASTAATETGQGELTVTQLAESAQNIVFSTEGSEHEVEETLLLAAPAEEVVSLAQEVEQVSAQITAAPILTLDAAEQAEVFSDDSVDEMRDWADDQ